MKVVYETHGRAREYNEIAVNLYSGCSHGCLYCFGPNVLHKTQAEFFKNPQPRKNVIPQLARDVDELAKKGEKRPILLSFVTDPYQPVDGKYHLTRQAIEILKARGLSVAILTKGGIRASGDFDMLGHGDQFGTTLTLRNQTDIDKWEPGASDYYVRVGNLQKAKERGIKTFVSLEPILSPVVAAEIVTENHEYVDFWKVGKLNYHPLAKEIDWKKTAELLIKTLDVVGASYYIKKDLAQYVGKPEGILKQIER